MKTRIVVGVAGVVLGVLVIASGPWVLRSIPFFSVRQVELRGVRYHSPERLLQALNIAPDQNLFDSLREIEERTLLLPGVVSARAKRRLPGTLTIEVGESVPVAFVPTSTGLLAIDEDATPLTYDPTLTGLDLPIVQTADTALARVLAAVRSADSVLFECVDAARFATGNAVMLQLGATSVILRNEPTADEILAVALVRRSLASSGKTYDELDARFDGRVLVRGSGA